MHPYFLAAETLQSSIDLIAFFYSILIIIYINFCPDFMHKYSHTFKSYIFIVLLYIIGIIIYLSPEWLVAIMEKLKNIKELKFCITTRDGIKQ